ncbi:origin recognition complex, subunit 6 [Aspergillus coremiiformis]|uniref:Origin recognition complex, subunit 6 n=1 Tax=Aspergillus coremiiformis TaxID=138285 RepID=A0A5N6ZG09_9EURO|nr:origin recognition complex, subunit 6 [Aspergillus coremiiformis]
MNNRPVEQALGTLLPTHASDLPQELLSLALSLVAQSRSFSTSLRPEEEIARPYACAEIACRRLTRALKLPPVMGHPPCPPRAYKKLYAFLDRSLSNNVAGVKRPGTGSTSGTPSRPGSVASTPTKDSKYTKTPSNTATTPHRLQTASNKPTPLKKSVLLNEESNSRSQTPKNSKVRPNGLPGSTIIPDAPAWVMTSIRNVCKTLSTPAPRTSTWSRPPISRTLPPHMFAGVSSILYFISLGNKEDTLGEETADFVEPILSAKDKENDEDYKEMVEALIVAVYFLALARRRSSSSDEEGETKKLDKKTFSEMRQTALVSLGLPSTERRHREDVDQWIAVIMHQGWANEKEWFENIPQAGELDGDAAYLSDADGYNERDDQIKSAKRQKPMPSGPFRPAKQSSKKGLLPGLGTMMQDRVDWLSDDRKEDYLVWKAAVLARIDQMEKTAARHFGVLPV